MSVYNNTDEFLFDLNADVLFNDDETHLIIDYCESHLEQYFARMAPSKISKVKSVNRKIKQFRLINAEEAYNLGCCMYLKWNNDNDRIQVYILLDLDYSIRVEMEKSPTQTHYLTLDKNVTAENEDHEHVKVNVKCDYLIHHDMITFKNVYINLLL